MGTLKVLRPTHGRWPQPVWRLVVPVLLLGWLATLATVPDRSSSTGRAPAHGTDSILGSTTEDLAAQQMAALRRMKDALAYLAAERVRRGLPIDRRIDPSGTGLIGVEWTPITTTLGNLAAKRTAVNPEWARVVVRLLRDAGVRSGDVVAVGLSGSFPGLNVAVFTAVEAMDAHLAAVASLGASMWGANIPNWTWLDMERALRNRDLISEGSLAYTPGGEGDRVGGLTSDGLPLLQQAARRNGVELLRPRDLKQAVEERLKLLDRAATRWGRPIKVYVNVGGSEASLGRCEAMVDLPPGLLQPHQIPACSGGGWEQPGVISHMGRRGIPVLQLLDIRDIAVRYGVPLDPMFEL